MSELIDKQVLVTTEYRGVFGGRLVEWDRATRTAVLAEARNCTYWPKECKGFLGLAAVGPVEGARIGPSVDRLELAGVTSISPMTGAAAKKWSSAPWN